MTVGGAMETPGPDRVTCRQPTTPFRTSVRRWSSRRPRFVGCRRSSPGHRREDVLLCDRYPNSYRDGYFCACLIWPLIWCSVIGYDLLCMHGGEADGEALRTFPAHLDSAACGAKRAVRDWLAHSPDGSSGDVPVQRASCSPVEHGRSTLPATTSSWMPVRACFFTCRHDGIRCRWSPTWWTTWCLPSRAPSTRCLVRREAALLMKYREVNRRFERDCMRRAAWCCVVSDADAASFHRASPQVRCGWSQMASTAPPTSLPDAGTQAIAGRVVFGERCRSPPICSRLSSWWNASCRSSGRDVPMPRWRWWAEIRPRTCRRLPMSACWSPGRSRVLPTVPRLFRRRYLSVRFFGRLASRTSCFRRWPWARLWSRLASASVGSAPAMVRRCWCGMGLGRLLMPCSTCCQTRGCGKPRPSGAATDLRAIHVAGTGTGL